MTSIEAAQAYRLWAGTYDLDPNPVVALEHRVLRERLNLAPSERLLDLATGTGRWLMDAFARDISAIGIDLSPEMLEIAASKGGAKGRLACGDVCALPFAADAADVALCSFGLGYIERVGLAFREMGRVARRIIVSDLHPEAVRSGWTRSFRAGGEKYRISDYDHAWTAIQAHARAAGLRLLWSVDAFFGEPERVLFERAGKVDAFHAAQHIPAVLAAAWVRE